MVKSYKGHCVLCALNRGSMIRGFGWTHRLRASERRKFGRDHRIRRNEIPADQLAR